MKANRTSSLPMILFALLLGSSSFAAELPELIAAVRKGDGSKVQELLKNPDQATARDHHGNTALHWAALANNAPMVAELLEAGIDARAANNAGATPLHYGAGSDRVLALLLKAGANPNARSVAGNTPLHSAAARPESFAQVKLLLEAGAEAYAVRHPQGPFEGRETPLSLAALAGEKRTVELLLDHGTPAGLTPDPRITDALSAAALSAAFAGNEDILKLLLSRGGSVNFDGGFAGHALNTAFYAGHQNIARFLLEQPGIDLRLKSAFGEAVPPMVWSGYDETGDPAIARLLLSRGADINEASSAGSTALSWALKRGETALVAFLRSQGANEETTQLKRKSIPNHPVPEDASTREGMIRDGAQRAVILLQRSSDAFLENGFVKQSSCVSCHQQTLPAVTFAIAQGRGLRVDPDSLARQLSFQQTGWSGTRDRAYELHAPQPAPAAVLGYGLHGLHALRYEPDDLTDAMSYYLAETQLPDGSWPDYDFRPPMEAGPIVGTALTLKALQFYPPPVETQPLKTRVQKARRYLEHAKPVNFSQQLFRYHGLGWAGATPEELRRDTEELLELQRADGGWAPLPNLESDSWATGHALVALREVGGVPVSHAAYQRGIEFLLRTQFEDGSWWVKSRTWPFQPHFDSAFPHGKDQWISAGGTAWAAMALLLALEPDSPKSAFPTGQQLIASTAAKAAVAAQANGSKPAASSLASVDFEREIRPIFERSCTGCHSGEKPKGAYNLTSHDTALAGGQSGEPAIVPGQAERSALLRFVQDQVEDLEMPPLSKREKFPAFSKEEVSKLSNWIAAGATWPQGAILRGPEK